MPNLDELIAEARDRAAYMKMLAKITGSPPGASVTLEDADRMTRLADALVSVRAERDALAAIIEQVMTFAREQHDYIKATYDFTGALDSHRHGYMSACADILDILEQAKEGKSYITKERTMIQFDAEWVREILAERFTDGGEAFDRWLTKHDADVAAKAWDEGHDAGWNSRDDDAARGWVPSGVHESDAVNPYRKAVQDD